jgi:hypothetical protein
LGEFISRKQTNLSALTSIVEVKVETALISEEKQGKSTLSEQGNLYLTFILCSCFAILNHLFQKECVYTFDDRNMH